MFRAMEQQTMQVEARTAFVREAIEAREAMDATGVGYEAVEAHAYLAARMRGEKGVRRPDPKPWRG